MTHAVMHYSGAIEWVDKRGCSTTKLAGWAACADGDRAWAIRRARPSRQTTDRDAVTCKACLRALEREDDTAARKCRDIGEVLQHRGIVEAMKARNVSAEVHTGRVTGPVGDGDPFFAAVIERNSTHTPVIARDPETGRDMLGSGDTKAAALRDLRKIIEGAR